MHFGWQMFLVCPPCPTAHHVHHRSRIWLLIDWSVDQPIGWQTDMLLVLCSFCILKLNFFQMFNLISFFILAREEIWQIISPNTNGYFCLYWQWKSKKFLSELFLIIIRLLLARSVCLLTEKNIKQQVQNIFFGLKKESFNLVIWKQFKMVFIL